MPETAVYNCEKIKTAFNKLFYLNNIAISKVGVAKWHGFVSLIVGLWILVSNLENKQTHLFPSLHAAPSVTDERGEKFEKFGEKLALIHYICSEFLECNLCEALC